MRLDGPQAGDRLWLALAVAVLTLAALITPSTETLSLFGFDIPELCTFRRLTGWSCPGCGLTRSFVFLAHGQPLEAVRMNLLGPPLFLALAAQIPLRLVRLWRARVDAHARQLELARPASTKTPRQEVGSEIDLPG